MKHASSTRTIKPTAAQITSAAPKPKTKSPVQGALHRVAITQSELKLFGQLEACYLQCRESLARRAPMGVPRGPLKISRKALSQQLRRTVLKAVAASAPAAAPETTPKAATTRSAAPKRKRTAK